MIIYTQNSKILKFSEFLKEREINVLQNLILYARNKFLLMKILNSTIV